MQNEIVRLQQQLDGIERAIAAQEGLRGILPDGQVDEMQQRLKVRGRELQAELIALTGAGTIAQDGSTAVGQGAVLIGGDSHAAVVAGDNNTITHIINQYQSASGTIIERERLQKQMACYLRWMVDRFGKIVLRGIELRDKRVVEVGAASHRTVGTGPTGDHPGDGFLSNSRLPGT